MRELNIAETQEVNGGNPVVVGIAGSFLASYLYDAAGGYEGINQSIRDGVDAVGDVLSDMSNRGDMDMVK